MWRAFVKVNLKTLSDMNTTNKPNKLKINKIDLSGKLNVLKCALRELNREDTNINHLEGLLKHERRSYNLK